MTTTTTKAAAPPTPITPGSGPALADELGESFAAGQFVRSDGAQLVGADLRESVTAISTAKNIQAKKIQAAEKTLELGAALGIGAAGGEVLYHDMTTGTETHFLGPRKGFNATDGTAGGFTNGRVIGAFTTIVLQPGDTILSDSVTAQVGVNNDTTKIKFLYTIADPTDVMVTQLIGRFNVAATGVRMVIRHTSASGQVIFESEPQWTWETGQGLSVAGTGDTTFDTEENPIIFRSGSTYHITIEKFNGSVVMKGAMVSGSFLPYISRRRATVVLDPVVARGFETLTTAQTFDALDWYETKYCNGTFAVRMPPIAASAGLDLALVNIGTGVITVNDNAGANLDAVLPGEVAVFESDGAAIRRVNRDRINETTALAETIAGVEARIGILETNVDETGPDNGLMASVASLASQVQALDIPALESVQPAIASIVARLEALQVPAIDGLEASIGSLRIALDALQIPATGRLDAALASMEAKVEALDIPAVDGQAAAVASLASPIARHDNRLDLSDTDRSALAETIAGVEATATGHALESQNADDSLAAAVASMVSKDEVERQSREDSDVSLAETVAGVEADLQARRDFLQVVKSSSSTLTGASGTYGDVPAAASGAALAMTIPVPGRYRLTQTVRGGAAAPSVGSMAWITARLFNATSGLALPNSETIVVGNANTAGIQSTTSTSIIVDFNVSSEIRLQAYRGNAGTVPTILADANGWTSIMYERIG